MIIIVRESVVQDWDAMRQLFLKSRCQTFPWLPLKGTSLTDLDEQIVGEAIWIAQNTEGKLIGFISVWEAEHFIHHLYVDSTYHRCGVGRMLLQVLPEWGKQSYQLKCLRCNENALSFYDACGFCTAGEGEDRGGKYLLLKSMAGVQ